MKKTDAPNKATVTTRATDKDVTGMDSIALSQQEAVARIAEEQTRFMRENEPKKIFVICSVRGMDETYRHNLEEYVAILESEGCKVHLPHRDTNQKATGLNICKQNMDAIRFADEVHIFYSRESQGTHFDMGVAFALDKKIVIAENEAIGPWKSYARMLYEWGMSQ